MQLDALERHRSRLLVESLQKWKKTTLLFRVELLMFREPQLIQYEQRLVEFLYRFLLWL